MIIAELGVNHNGDLNRAILMADTAAKLGATNVKIQSFIPSRLADDSSSLVGYQSRNGVRDRSQFEMLLRLALSPEEQAVFFGHCREVGINAFSTPYDISSMELLLNLGIQPLKVASMDIVDYTLLSAIDSFAGEVILSTGGATLEEVRAALDFLGNSKVRLMHATSNYPASIPSLNLGAIETLKTEFHLEVGYSDHSANGVASPLALAAGATFFERHFTLDRSLPGPDQSASDDPEGFEAYVASIHQAKIAMGDGGKLPSEEEESMLANSRKRFFLSSTLKTGEVLSLSNLEARRSQHGITAAEALQILGKKASRDIAELDSSAMDAFK